MPLSFYLKVFRHPFQRDKALVFSTRRGAVLAVPGALLTRMSSNDVPASAREELIRLGLWVTDPAGERDEVWGYLDEVNRLDSGVTVAVILGLGCNFACPYCYEGEKGGQAMGEDTGTALVRFLQGRFRRGKQALTLDFCGGEPLLYPTRIRQLTEALKPWVEARGGRFRFNLVTNGSLLTPAVVDELAPLGLAGVKVTLDGPGRLHDRSRPFRNGKGSFETVLANLQAVTERPQGVKLGLGGNFTEQNWRRFPELLDHLGASRLGPDRVSQIMFAPVLRSGAAAADACAGCASVNEVWLAEACVALREAVLSRGYRVPKIVPSPCMADLRDAFTVNWDGTLTKCPALISQDSFAVGDVWRGVTKNVAATFGGSRWKAETRCRDSAYLPLCFGGCRYMQWQRERSMLGVECQAGFLDATLEPMLWQDVKYRREEAKRRPPLS